MYMETLSFLNLISLTIHLNMKNHNEMYGFIRDTTNAATSSLRREVHNGKFHLVFSRAEISLWIYNERPFLKCEVAALLCREENH